MDVDSSKYVLHLKNVLVFQMLGVHSYFHVTYTHQSICTLKGSSVDISCSYTYPSGHTVSETNWYTKGKLDEAPQILSPGYGGRVEYLRNMQSDSTLRITDLREEDSAEYKLRVITDQTNWEPTFPGTSLTVTGLQVKVTPATVTEGQKVTLTCSTTTCTLSDNPNPTYIWYKNGHVTNQSNSLFLNPVSSEDAGRYSCAVEGHEVLHSPEETLTVRYGPKNSSVSVSPSGKIVEGSDANPPVDKYTWYKKNVTSPKASGQSYNITNISSEDSGEYYCEARNKITSKNSIALMIMVAGKQTSVMTAAVGIIVVVLVLILCLSGFTWFRKKSSKSTSDTRDTADDGQRDSSPVYDNISGMAMTPTATQRAATVDQDDVHYASVHFSRSKNQEVPLYSTVQLPQPQKQDEDVQYAAVKFNCPSAATRSQSLWWKEGSSVTLTCSSDVNPPVEKYTWYKKNVTSPKASGQSYSITNISSEDIGEYCEVENKYGLNSSSVFVDVQHKHT
ncbi:hypothetical protein J4Q44_G00289760 [Coregonus suidteri]|uniref:Ig-like domain-containing protein n=1 Tax=Coregonus suidteri TaxID=861788 RepID=A0AAN8KZC7_9TELE